MGVCSSFPSVSVPHGGDEDISAEVTLAGDDVAEDALHITNSHLSKRALTFALFVDNFRVQPQLFTGLGAQLYSVG